jgi:hypothetical protein
MEQGRKSFGDKNFGDVPETSGDPKLPIVLIGFQMKKQTGTGIRYHVPLSPPGLS